MDVVPLKDHFGVDVTGFVMSDLDDPDGVRALRGAFDAGFLLMRRQSLSDDEQDKLVKVLGELHRFPSGKTFEYMSNIVEEEFNIAGTRRLLFHNDGSYGEHVAPGTCLYAIEVSPTSSPTAFADTVRAYEQLPKDVRDLVDGLTAFHTFNVTAALNGDEPTRYRIREHAEPPEGVQLKWAIHPAVIEVPHTGKRALFVSEFNASHFVELGPDSDEGEELLQTIFGVLYSEENVYTHHYETGDVVIWNNLSTQHARVTEIDRAPRTFRRLVLTSLNW